MALTLKYLKKELDLKESFGVVYGMFDNYLATFSHKNKEIEIFVDAKVDPSDGEAVGRLRTFIQNNAAGYKITASSLSNTGISITVGIKDQDLVSEFFYLLINQLKILKIRGADYCANCGGAIKGGRKIVKIGSHSHSCDEDCAEKIMSSKRATAARTKVSRHGFPGFLGALIFCLIGSAPYFYLGYNGYSCAYAAFLIPLAAALGFFLFGGRRGWAKLLTCALVPAAVFLAVSCVLLGYSVYSFWFDAGYVFTVPELASAVLDGLSADGALRDGFIFNQLLTGVFFLLAGYVFTLPTAFARPDPYFAILKDNF
jgi:hypothetical protein